MEMEFDTLILPVPVFNVCINSAVQNIPVHGFERPYPGPTNEGRGGFDLDGSWRGAGLRMAEPGPACQWKNPIGDVLNGFLY